jgi:hypothetical protein
MLSFQGGIRVASYTASKRAFNLSGRTAMITGATPDSVRLSQSPWELPLGATAEPS